MILDQFDPEIIVILSPEGYRPGFPSIPSAGAATVPGRSAAGSEAARGAQKKPLPEGSGLKGGPDKRLSSVLSQYLATTGAGAGAVHSGTIRRPHQRVS